MPRRRTVVLASAITLFAIGGLLALGVATLTQTAWGREQIRARVMALINANLQGTIYIGRLQGSLFSDLAVDSFAIRERNDSVFVATGPIRVRFDPRDLLDRRIVISEITVERPVIHVHEDSARTWNFRRIFPPGPPGPPPSPTARNFGDFVVVNSARLRDATFLLTMPWEPEDSLRGAKRDSAIAYALSRDDKDIRRVGSHYEIQRRWTNAQLELGPSRIDDRDRAGRQFDVRRLDADEFDPPFAFRDVQGSLRNKGDSLWVELEHFRLPGSRGTATGKVWWGSDLPTRYDLTFAADTLSLADVAWVYPTLPTTGGGRATLHIRNGADLEILEYALRDVDVRTTDSRLRGSMTFATGAPLFIVKDIDLRADPIDWRLIERFSGDELPYPWRGAITATVRASGGPVNRFTIDEVEFFFRDANVPGATARGVVRGELDILEPAFTVFRGLDVSLDHFDLRTMQFLNPTFPRLFGMVSGTARLDSVWTDLRFRNADLRHRFEDGAESRFTGNGRVTIGERDLTYDLALTAEPISLTTIARAWPEAELAYRGEYSGPLRLQGTAADLSVATELTGAPGLLAYDGRVDADSVGGYGYHGTLRFADLNLRLLLDTASVPHTQLTGTVDIDVVGDSLANWVGPLDLRLERSLVDSVRVYSGARARVRFGDGHLRVDTLHAESALLSVGGQGGLGLMPHVRDSLAFVVSADSLGALRQYLGQRSAGDSVAREELARDSLGAEIDGRGVLSGSLDSLGVRAALDVRALRYGTASARVARVSADLQQALLPTVRGRVRLSADTVLLGGVAVAHAGTELEVQGRERVAFSLLAALANGPVAEGRGVLGLREDTTVVGLDALRIGLEGREWTLARAASVRTAGGGFAIDTLRLTGSRGGEIVLAGAAPVDSAVQLLFRMDSVSLADLANLAQARVGLGGWLSTRVDVSGTREAPIMTLSGGVTGATVGQVNVARAALQGRYADTRATFGLDVLRGDTTVVAVRGNVPIDLALAPRANREVNDTLRISVRSNNLDMSVVESFIPTLSSARGRLNADVALVGTTQRSALEGFLRADAVAASVPDLGIRLRDVNADLVAARDTVRIRRLSMVSGPEPRDSLWLAGWVARLQPQGAAFDVTLGAREFQAIASRRVAELTVSANLRLSGSLDRSQLSGSVTLNSGVIVIPEFTGKQLISLDDPELYNVVDTTVFANRALLPRTPPAFVNNLTVDNVRIAMGSDVRVRSEEADIKLGGAVNVTVGERRGGVAPQLALDGALQTERGYYRLDLGGLVQRTFTVEGGELRFLNETELNPVLNISALHTVRQMTSTYGGRNDVRIRVLVQGTLIQPRLRLESADSLQLSESDLISYLVAGVPSFGIGGDLGQNRFSASSIALSTLSSYISAKFSGGLFDYVNIQTASGAGSGQQQQSRQGLLNGVQFGVGKQLGDRTFLSLTTGLCRLGGAGGAQLNPIDLASSIGVKLEHRLTAGYGFSFSLEPPLNELFCGTGTDRSFTTTRRQYGFDVFRAWRW